MSAVRCAVRGIIRTYAHRCNSINHISKCGLSTTTEKLASSNWPHAATATAAATAAIVATGYFGSIALAQSPKQDPHLSIEKPPDVWDRWDQVKNFLFGWEKAITGTGGGGGDGDVPLPTDKLACHVGSNLKSGARPIVLVSCGSFNPPTTMHVRMLELARQELFSRGYDVLGAFLSPVNDAYWKRDLAPGRHRVQLCHAATASSDFIMVDAWEVEQQQYTRTLYVLEHIEKRLCKLFQSSPGDDSTNSNITSTIPTTSSSSTNSSTNETGVAVTSKSASPSFVPPGCPPSLQPRTMLVCGADVVETMADASLWKQDLLETLLRDHGVVCITRDGAGANAAWLLAQPGTLLHQYRDNVIVVQDPVPNEVSSSAVRRELKEQRSVKYLIDPGVEEYIRKHGLYGTGVSKKV